MFLECYSFASSTVLMQTSPSENERQIIIKKLFAHHKLTVIDTFFPTEIHTLGQLSCCLTTIGWIRAKELTISLSNAGGADAVRAMMGALVMACNPPSFRKAVRNFGPLQNNTLNMFEFSSTLYTVEC